MKKTVILLFLFLGTVNLWSNPQNFNKYFIDASGKVKPSVVNIIAYTRKISRGKYTFIKNAYGTGTIISSNGFVVTNNHLVKGSNYFQVIDYQGNRFDFQKFSENRNYLSDLKTDLALLKIYSESKRFQPIKFSDSSTLVEGEWVLAIGNPYGLKQSITAGIVSSKGRDNIGFTDIEDFIQTDVSINPGNSGGPLVNLYGEMVGINTAIRSESGGFQGISFSIPSNIVRKVCSDLIKYGRVKRGWLGFIAAEKKVRNGRAGNYIEIISVIKNSPAYRGGILSGDIIKKIDGEKIHGLGALIRLIGNKEINSNTQILISRNGTLKNISFVLREKKEYFNINKDLEYLFKRYGIEVDINSLENGVVLTYISPHSPFYQLKRGDVVYEINGYRINGIENFFRLLKNDTDQNMLIRFIRESGKYEIQISK